MFRKLAKFPTIIPYPVSNHKETRPRACASLHVKIDTSARPGYGFLSKTRGRFETVPASSIHSRLRRSAAIARFDFPAIRIPIEFLIRSFLRLARTTRNVRLLRTRGGSPTGISNRIDRSSVRFLMVMKLKRRA